MASTSSSPGRGKRLESPHKLLERYPELMQTAAAGDPWQTVLNGRMARLHEFRERVRLQHHRFETERTATWSAAKKNAAVEWAAAASIASEARHVAARVEALAAKEAAIIAKEKKARREAKKKLAEEERARHKAAAEAIIAEALETSILLQEIVAVAHEAMEVSAIQAIERAAADATRQRVTLEISLDPCGEPGFDLRMEPSGELRVRSIDVNSPFAGLLEVDDILFRFNGIDLTALDQAVESFLGVTEVQLEGCFLNADKITAETAMALERRARAAAARLAAQEAAREKAEADLRKAEEEARQAEVDRIAALEAKRQAAEAEAARQKAAEEEKAMAKAAEEKAARQKAEEEAAARQRAEEEAAAEMAERKRVADEEAAAKAEDEAHFAAEEAAAIEAKRKEVERLTREQTLVISDIRAHGVPVADRQGLSDPYASFTLLNGTAGMTAPMGRTQPIYNNLDPTWTDRVQLFLAAGTAAAMDGVPSVLVRLYDHDLSSPDTLLGEREVELAAESGSQEELSLRGVDGFKDSTISFRFALSSIISPAATILISGISATGLPKGKRLPGGKMVGDKGASFADPYLRFRLLETMGAEEAMATTPAIPDTTKPNWGDLELALPLPRGSARPPLLGIGLWDDNVKTDDDALAFLEIRLPNDGGEQSVKMVGRKGSGCKHVNVSFTVTVKHGY
jgi:hypothetical protein